MSLAVRSRPVKFYSGPVAQLGARFHGMEEVVGSIPTRSTKSLNKLERANGRSFGVVIQTAPFPTLSRSIIR